MYFAPLTDCCCGCSLRTGAKIIGWCFLILSSIFFVVTFFFFVAVYGVCLPDPQEITIDYIVSEFGLLIVVACSCTEVCFASVLLLGIYLNRPKLLRYWVYINWIKVSVMLPLVMVTVVFKVVPQGFLLFLLPFLAVDVYYIRIVNSYYEKIIEKTDQVKVLTDII